MDSTTAHPDVKNNQNTTSIRINTHTAWAFSSRGDAKRKDNHNTIVPALFGSAVRNRT